MGAVLVIDDDPHIRELVELLLREPVSRPSAPATAGKRCGCSARRPSTCAWSTR